RAGGVLPPVGRLPTGGARPPRGSSGPYLASAVASAASAFSLRLFQLYFFWNFSTRPVVSTNFLLPVKNGWHAEQISTLMTLRVLRVVNLLPQPQVTVASWYWGWMSAFMVGVRIGVRFVTPSLYTARAGALRAVAAPMPASPKRQTKASPGVSRPPLLFASGSPGTAPLHPPTPPPHRAPRCARPPPPRPPPPPAAPPPPGPPGRPPPPPPAAAGRPALPPRAVPASRHCRTTPGRPVAGPASASGPPCRTRRAGCGAPATRPARLHAGRR